ncbi:MAG: SDR family oxidoreductase, partial [Phycisphaerales bacterium]|nr:SDR family oxidoreductase [Phycisphaerales bacterium]
MRSMLFSSVLLVLVAVVLATGTSVGAPPAERHTVLVTGANRGLGLEFAKQFAAAGYEVIGTARRPVDAEALKATGARVVALDVTDAESVKSLVATLDGAPIDVLINNAGIGSRGGRLADLDLDAARRVLEVNTLGPMRVTQALLPNLRRGERKIVVNISSGLGSVALNEGGGYYAYRESKTALNQFTRSLAAELRPEGFICFAMSPGWVRTDMGGASAPLAPEESIAG